MADSCQHMAKKTPQYCKIIILQLQYLKSSKKYIMASGPIASWQIYKEKRGNSNRFYFLGPPNHCGQ